MTNSKAGDFASVTSAIASLVSALAWPLIAGLLLYGLYEHADSVVANLARLIGDSGSAKLSLPGGFSFELNKTATASANAVIQSAKKSSTGPLSESQVSQVATSAQSAALKLSATYFDPQKRLRVLWVDDHPENNIDLQFAFQALGIIVIYVDSNTEIQQSFQVTSGFDVVITDMVRDEMANGRRPADPEGGQKTVDDIRKGHPGVPVIVYAGSWSAAHRNDSLQSPIIAITNYPQEVYEKVTELAKRKAG